MAMDGTSRSIEARVEGLTGRPALPADAVRKSIQQIQNKRTATLQEERERQAQAARLLGTLSESAIAAAEQNAMAVDAARELGTLGEPEPVIRPPIVEQVRPVFWPYQVTVTIPRPTHTCGTPHIRSVRDRRH
jgi:hypothetical protein